MVAAQGEPNKLGEKIMFRFKKLAFLFIVTAMILAACGGGAEAPAPAEPAEPEAPAEPEMPEGGLACSPNCQYSDVVVGFLQTG